MLKVVRRFSFCFLFLMTLLVLFISAYQILTSNKNPKTSLITVLTGHT